MVSDLKILAGSAAAIAALLCPENNMSIQSSSRRLLMDGQNFDGTPATPELDMPNETLDLTFGNGGGGGGMDHTYDGGDNSGNLDRLGVHKRVVPKQEAETRKRVSIEDLLLERYRSKRKSTSGLHIPDDVEEDLQVSNTMIVLKTVGLVSLLAGLTFSVTPMGGLPLILIIGFCITLGILTLALGNKFGGKWRGLLTTNAAHAILIAGSGFAVTYSLYAAEYAATNAATTPADIADQTQYLLQADRILAAGAFVAVLALFLVGLKLMGHNNFFKKGSFNETCGLLLAVVGAAGLASTTIPDCFAEGDLTKQADWIGNHSELMTVISLATIWCGLLWFTIGFLRTPGQDNRANVSVEIFAGVTLCAGLVAVIGSGLQMTTETSTAHQIGSECLKYGGITFIVLLATIFVFFSYKFCNKPKGGAGLAYDRVEFDQEL